MWDVACSGCKKVCFMRLVKGGGGVTGGIVLPGFTQETWV
jgi:hypothetical protein